MCPLGPIQLKNAYRPAERDGARAGLSGSRCAPIEWHLNVANPSLVYIAGPRPVRSTRTRSSIACSNGRCRQRRGGRIREGRNQVGTPYKPVRLFDCLVVPCTCIAYAFLNEYTAVSILLTRSCGDFDGKILWSWRGWRRSSLPY